MSDKKIYILGIVGTLLMLANMYHILVQMPDEAVQGPIGKMLLIHAPAAFAAFTFYGIAVWNSVLFLAKKDFRRDSLAVAAVEVAQVFTLINLVTGSLWGHIIWGIWWTWDFRLTSQFMCFMLYLGYSLVRPAIADATQRATMSAVIAILAVADIPLVFFAIRLRDARMQHPSPVLETGKMDPSWWPPFLLSWVIFSFIGGALMIIRRRQENARREIDSLRRELHAI